MGVFSYDDSVDKDIGLTASPASDSTIFASTVDGIAQGTGNPTVDATLVLKSAYAEFDVQNIGNPSYPVCILITSAEVSEPSATQDWATQYTKSGIDCVLINIGGHNNIDLFEDWLEYQPPNFSSLTNYVQDITDRICTAGSKSQ